MILLMIALLVLALSLLGAVLVRQIRKLPDHSKSARDKNYRAGFAPPECAKRGFSPKKIPKEVDVVIIGSGVAGKCAWQLLLCAVR